MKKVIFAFLLLLTISIGYSQTVTVTTSPLFGCPNKTHNVTITVTNGTTYSVPPMVPYNVNVTVTTPSSTTIGTFSQSYSDGFPSGTSRSYTVSVTFLGEMTCNVDGTLSVPLASISYPYSTTYDVRYPDDVTLTENPTGTLLVSSVPNDHEIRFYKDGSETHEAQAASSFTPTVSGSYTAKAYEPVSGCVSENVSNAVTITVATTDVKEGQNTSVSVYPNPMASSVTITTILSNKLSYELVDLNGSIVRSADFTTATNINVENLKAGSYVLTVKDNNQKVASYKLVK